METLFGISEYKAIEYPFGTSIEKVASSNDFIIKRIEGTRDYYQDYRFSYKIFNKNLKPHTLSRNGWSLEDFDTNTSWNPGVLHPVFRDISNKKQYDFTAIVNEVSFSMIGHISGRGRGVEAINSILEQFLDLSEYKNWIDYIGQKYHIVLADKPCQNLSEEKKKEDEVLTLKGELEKLQHENEALKAKLKQLEPIIAKANRILQKLLQK
jgi:hypothetical protein